jgi:polyphosphate kinase 2 (PPK2 family)
MSMADDMTKGIAKFIEPFRVTPGSKVTLAENFDPAFKAGIEKKRDGVGLLNDGIELLSEYQQRLAAESAHGVVVVLQALDAAGKDGTIRHVMSGVNPQGVRVESFKVPSDRERGQDYLRRASRPHSVWSSRLARSPEWLQPGGRSRLSSRLPKLSGGCRGGQL